MLLSCMWTRMSTSIQTSQWIDHVITVSSAPHERPSPAFDLGMGQKHPRPCSSHQKSPTKNDGFMEIYPKNGIMDIQNYGFMDLFIQLHPRQNGMISSFRIAESRWPSLPHDLMVRILEVSVKASPRSGSKRLRRRGAAVGYSLGNYHSCGKECLVCLVCWWLRFLDILIRILLCCVLLNTY